VRKIHEAEKWTSWAWGKLQEQRLLARTNTVVMRSDIEGLVWELNDNVYTVNLADKTCSCTGFQENGIPCSHAITTIFTCTGRDLAPYILEYIVSIPGDYDNFHLIDITDLQPLPFS